jgi:hypothetical protein
MDISNHLFELADHLDSLGLQKCADLVDDVIKSKSLIKVAQYVGVIGYVLKQNRAMSNCIRKSRVSSDLSMQEIVLGCLKEYQDGQDYQNTEWHAKYAQTVKAEPLLFNEAHLLLLAEIGKQNNIPTHVENIRRLSESLQENEIDDSVISKVLSHIDTLGNLLQQEVTDTRPFKVSAALPKTAKWDWLRRLNPFGKGRSTQQTESSEVESDDKKALSEVNLILDKITSITQIGYQTKHTINRLKSVKDYLAGVSQYRKNQGTVSDTDRIVARRLSKAIGNLDQNSWTKNIRILQELKWSTENQKVQSPAIKKYLNISQKLADDLLNNIDVIYDELENINDTMRSLRKRESVTGQRGFGYSNQGEATSSEIESLQQIVDYISQNPLDTRAHTLAQRSIGRITDLLYGAGDEISYQSPANIREQLEELKQSIQTPSPAPAPAPAASATTPAPAAQPSVSGVRAPPPKVTTDTAKVDIIAKHLAGLISAKEFNAEQVQTVIMAIAKNLDKSSPIVNILEQVSNKLESSREKNITSVQKSKTTVPITTPISVPGPKNPTSPLIGPAAEMPPIAPPTVASKVPFIIRLADAIDQVDSEVANIIDEYIEGHIDEIDAAIKLPNYSVLIKE